MNTFKTTLLMLMLMFGATSIYAGTGHDHGHSHDPISASDAQTKASQKVKQMVDAGKIDPTWVEAKSDKVYQKDYGHGPEWVVTFKNDKVSDKSKQTLYIFYSQDGHYLAANYDGN